MVWLFGWSSDKKARDLEAASETVVHRVQHTVWELVSRQIVSMGQAEAYGYTWARARGIVDQATTQLASSHSDWTAKDLDGVRELALGQLAGYVWHLAQQAKEARQRRRRAA